MQGASDGRRLHAQHCLPSNYESVARHQTVGEDRQRDMRASPSVSADSVCHRFDIYGFEFGRPVCLHSVSALSQVGAKDGRASSAEFNLR